MWKEDAPDKAAFVPPRVPSESSVSDGSEDTEAAGARGSVGSQTVYGAGMPRMRSTPISTNASRGSGSRSDDRNSPKHSLTDLPENGMDRPQRSESLPRGYELCVGCIEQHGIAHSKAAAKEAKALLSGTEVRRRRRAGELWHTYREKIWSAMGWQDVGMLQQSDESRDLCPEYAEESRCTICQTRLYSDCYKCQ